MRCHRCGKVPCSCPNSGFSSGFPARSTLGSQSGSSYDPYSNPHSNPSLNRSYNHPSSFGGSRNFSSCTRCGNPDCGDRCGSDRPERRSNKKHHRRGYSSSDDDCDRSYSHPKNKRPVRK